MATVKAAKSRKTTWRDSHCWMCSTKGDFPLFGITEEQRDTLLGWRVRIPLLVVDVLESLLEVRMCKACQEHTGIRNYGKASYGNA